MHTTLINRTLFACALLLTTASSPWAETLEKPPIKNGSDVTIKLSIQVPDDHLVISDRISEYTHGQQQLLPALEQALTGKKVGDTTHLELDPDKAFGPYDATRKVSVSRDKVPGGVKVGDIAKTAEGIPFTVLELGDRSALVDFNHPLAGKRVVFDVTILQVKPRS